MSIALHWINAVLVVALLVIGIMVWPMSRSPERSALLHLHVSLALVLLPFVIARVAWRMRHGKPITEQRNAWLRTLAGFVWRVLLVGVALQMVTGPLLVWMHGRPLEMFGLVSIPSPLPQMEEAHRLIVKPAHQALAIVIGAALLLHVLGALKHLLIDRDGVVGRMLGVPKAGARRDEDQAA